MLNRVVESYVVEEVVVDGLYRVEGTNKLYLWTLSCAACSAYCKLDESYLRIQDMDLAHSRLCIYRFLRVRRSGYAVGF